MKCGFSLLSQDEKTFTHVKEYYRAIVGGQNAMETDLVIQRHEIEAHLAGQGISIEDQTAISEWIKNNSSEFRTYLNSIKMVALMLIANRRGEEEYSEPVAEDFERAIRLWNLQKERICDSLFV